MIQEDKELLLKYLCMVLPYGVKGLRTYNKGEVVELSGILPCCNVSRNSDRSFIELQFTNLDCYVIDKFKPYLRPMSSMTEEEAMEYANCGSIIANSPQMNYLIPNPNSINWLLEHHFDFVGLIPKDLAIEVTETNNPYKE